MELVSRIEEFSINCCKGFMYSEVIDLENGKLIYSDKIEDYFWNYIIGINVDSKSEFDNVWKTNRKYLLDKNRKPVFYITPSSNMINNQNLLPDYMKIESKEVWMAFNKFENLPIFKDNGNIEITIDDNADLKYFADVFMESYSYSSDEDPYGEMPEYYRSVVANYKNNNDEYVKKFYIAKHNEKGIACALSIIKEDMALIAFVGTIKEYRNKGICKTLMNRILNDLKDKDVKIAYLQTEEGFIPEKIYSSIGFEKVCIAFIAVEDTENYNMR
jgi:N-acetylglutamate synthase-like GNAT family acetyltransferase